MKQTQAPSTPTLHRRAGPDVWDAVQEDYARGSPPRLLAERYGLGERNIRRRAAEEGWLRRPVPRGGLDADGAEALEPMLAEMSADRLEEQAELLLRPRPGRLLRYAFQRATEAAVLARPQDTLHWLRVVDHLRRNYQDIEAEHRLHDPSDTLRARYMDDNRPLWAIEEDAAGDDLPDPDDDAEVADSADIAAFSRKFARPSPPADPMLCSTGPGGAGPFDREV
jgi:hypothetical protein